MVQSYAPADLGFDATTRIDYVALTNLITFSIVLPDILINQVLRPGDRITITGTGQILEIVRTVSAVTAIARVIAGATANVDVGATVGFTIQQLAHSTKNDIVPKNETELIWQPPLGFFDIEHGIPPGGK